MKTLIIYFSQTGHTRTVAGVIRDGIVQAGGDCELVPLDAVDVSRLADFDLVGLGCPVFYYQEPLNVRSFVAALPPQSNRNWFAFCTHGSIMGNTLPSLAQGLRQKKARLIGFHHTYADSTLPFYPHPIYTSGHPDAEDLAEASAFGRDLVRRWSAPCDGQPATEATLEPIPEEWIKNAEAYTPDFLAKIFPPLSINREKCTECLDCQNGCPVNGIDILADPPVIQKPCLYCWNCVNVCAEGAVEADWEQQVQLAPKLLKRYRYWLDQAAAKGEFRWRIDPETVDFSNPYFRQKHKNRS